MPQGELFLASTVPGQYPVLPVYRKALLGWGPILLSTCLSVHPSLQLPCPEAPVASKGAGGGTAGLPVVGQLVLAGICEPWMFCAPGQAQYPYDSPRDA